MERRNGWDASRNRHTGPGGRRGTAGIVGFIVFIFILTGLAASPASAQVRTVVKELDGLAWNLDGESTPKVYWAPYCPMPTYFVLRYRFGARFSTGAISMKVPVRITMTYDDAQAEGGKPLRLRIKAEPMGCSGGRKTFDAAFGIDLQAPIQVGFVGITGLPDILPWWDAPVDMWDVIGFIPEVGGTITSAVSNIGVNMDSQDPVPLGTSVEYHDARDLISVDLKDLITDAETKADGSNAKPKDFATRIWDRIPGSVKRTVKYGIQGAKGLSDAADAEVEAIDYLATGLKVVTNAGALTLGADPYWKVQGEDLVVNVRYRVPNRAFSGNLPLTFTAAGQEREIDVLLPAFVSAEDVLEVLIDKITYRFRLYQTMEAHFNFSGAVDIHLGETEKLVRAPQVSHAFAQGAGNTMTVPLRAATGQVLDFKARGGYEAIQVFYASPTLSVKGTIDVFEGNGSTPVRTVSESGLATAHSMIVTGLKRNTSYRVRLRYQDAAGHGFTHPQEATAKTKSQAPSAGFKTELSREGVSISTPTVSAGTDSAAFTWTSTRKGSTMVYVSPSADFSLYTSAAKHTNGQVSTAYCDSVTGVFEMTKNHSLTFPGLDPGTTYHYLVRTWFYQDDDPSANPEFGLGYKGTFTTLDPPPQPSLRIKAVSGNQPQANLAVVLNKLSPAPSSSRNLTTGPDGLTPEALLEPGARYSYQVPANPCFQVSSGIRDVPANAQGPQPVAVLQLARRAPTDNFVTNAAGEPVRAKIKVTGTSVQMTAGADGRYGTALPGAPGSTVNLEVSLSGFITATVQGTVDECGFLTAPPVYLQPNTATLVVRALRSNGQPLSGVQVFLRDRGQTTGGVQIGVRTNAQGCVTYTHTFASAAPIEKTITVSPPSSNHQPGTADITLAPGQTLSQDVTVPDVAMPAIESVTLSQGPGHVVIHATTDSPVRAAVEYRTPDGQTRTGNYTTQAGTSHALDAPNASGNGGTFRVRVKIKDAMNREAVSDWQDFTFWGADDWNLQVIDRTMDGATVTWNRIRATPQFKSYYLDVAGTRLDIPNAATTRHTVTGLAPNRSHKIVLSAKDQQGQLFTPHAEVTIQTGSRPPSITSVQVTPSEVASGQAFTVSASVSDPDSNLKTVEILDETAGETSLFKKTCNARQFALREALTLSSPGLHKLRITAGDEASTVDASAAITVTDAVQPRLSGIQGPGAVDAGREWQGTLTVVDYGKMPKGLQVTIDWGDGKKTTARPRKDGKVEMEHVFDREGAFTVAARAVVKEKKTSVQSDPVTLNVTVQAVPPNLALAMVSQGSHNKTFHITVTPGSFPVTRWQLDFGDGKTPVRGSGPVDKNVSHTYAQLDPRGPATATFKAVLTVTDKNGNVFTREREVVVGNGPGESGQGGGSTGPSLSQTGDGSALKKAGGSTEPETESRPATEETGDLVLVSVTPPKTLQAGKRVTLTCSVKNAGTLPVKGCRLVLTVDGSETGAETFTMKAKAGVTRKLSFTPEQPGPCKIVVELIPPDGYKDKNMRNNRVQKTLRVK